MSESIGQSIADLCVSIAEKLILPNFAPVDHSTQREASQPNHEKDTPSKLGKYCGIYCFVNSRFVF